MNCEKVRTLINGFIDGELGELEARRIAQHLKSCASCSEEVRQYRATRDLVARFGAELAPAGLLNDIRMQLQKEQPARVSPFSRYRGALALAASFMIVLMGGLYFGLLQPGAGGLHMSSKFAVAPVSDEAAEQGYLIAQPAPEPAEDINIAAAGMDARSYGSAASDMENESAAPVLERSAPGLMAAAPQRSRPETLSPETIAPTAPAPTDLSRTRPEYIEPEAVPSPRREEITLDVRSADTVVRRDEMPIAAEDFLTPVADEAAEDEIADYEYDTGGIVLGVAGSRMSYGESPLEAEESADMGLPGLRMSQANYVRQAMFNAIDEKDMELSARANAAPAEAVPAMSVMSASTVAAAPGAPIATTVGYSRAGHSGFDYYNVPDNSDVLSYLITQNRAIAAAQPESARVTMMEVPQAERPVTRRPVPGEITAGNYVRAANIFFSDSPSVSAGDCMGFIREFLNGADDPATAWRRDGNYFIVKGSFSTLAPLRVRLMEEFSSVATGTASSGMSDSQIVAAASATHGIPASYPALLEIRFLQR